MMGSNRFRVDMPRFVDFYLQGKLHLDDMILIELHWLTSMKVWQRWKRVKLPAVSSCLTKPQLKKGFDNALAFNFTR